MIKSCNDKGKAVEGAMSLTIATIIVKILGAIYKIPISHVLGEEGMGYFNSAYTVYSFFYLLCTAGVPKAIMILCGELENEGKDKSALMKSAIGFFIIIGVSIALSFALLSRPLSMLIGSPNAYLSMIFIAPSIFFSAISGVFRGYFSFSVEFFRIAISQIIEGAGKLVFGLILGIVISHTSAPISTVSAFALLGASIGSFLSLVYLSSCANLRISKNKHKQKISLDEKTTLIKRILSIAFPISVGAIIMSITNIIDLGIVMNRLKSIGYSSSAATSMYGNYTTLATPIFNTVISLFVPITIAFMPSLIKEKNDMNKFNKILEEELRISSFIFIPLSIGVCVYSEEILKLLFNTSGIFLGSKLLICLMISILFIIPLYIINCAMEAKGYVKVTMTSMIVGGVCKIISGVLLIGSKSLGIYGAPISTLAFYSTALITSVGISYKTTKINLPLIKCISIPLINSFISIFTLYALYLYASTKVNWVISFIVSVALTVLLYFALNLIEGNLKDSLNAKFHSISVK